MKQISFFTDAEVKHFSLTDKIKIVLDKLCTNLQVTETNKKGDWITDPGHDDKKRRWIVYINTCNFNNVNNIKLPFEEIDLQVTEEKITVTGPNYNLTFAPDQLLTITNRYKKIKNLEKCFDFKTA